MGSDRSIAWFFGRWWFIGRVCLLYCINSRYLISSETARSCYNDRPWTCCPDVPSDSFDGWLAAILCWLSYLNDSGSWWRDSPSAKGPISALYLMRHMSDERPNYKTPVDVRGIHTPITPDQNLGYRVNLFFFVTSLPCVFFRTHFVLFAPLQGACELWPYLSSLSSLSTNPRNCSVMDFCPKTHSCLTTAQLSHQPYHPHHHFSTPHHGPFTHIHTLFVPSLVPKALSPVRFLVLFSLAYFSTSISASPPELFLPNTFLLVSIFI